MSHRCARLLAPLVLALAVAACAQEGTNGVPAADVAADEARIRELERDWVEFVRGRDTAAIAALHTEDAQLLAPGAPPAEGRQAVREAWAGFFAIPNLDLRWEPTRVVVAPSGEMAYTAGTYTMAYDGPNGRVEDQGKYLEVWRKVDGEWKVAADMFNSSRAAP